ncbi:MAG: DNA polymerase III subunit gamma/tau [Alphaproteobacteria bacterium]|nr:DNA polymerase III subunit gamma/tau [Alphaproteobacteria bacterium]
MQESGYKVLARKYRPKNFNELIGQDHMVQTLANAFETQRITQAWMLTGVRGVGKTTTARILARALNYSTDKITAPTVKLEELGEHCSSIMSGNHIDVVEMDAASHTGIDDIREIIDRIKYRPVSARYKVYIIDEVHMLSNQAFNGLLKTLEEPPSHAKFIFATTEIRKVPVTVLSRCQRFDLRRVDTELLTEYLKKIIQLENVQADEDALFMIARAGTGSVRDTLSILEQAIAYGNGQLQAAEVSAMLGFTTKEQIIALFEYIIQGEASKALQLFNDLYQAGVEPINLLIDLADFNHVVLKLKLIDKMAKSNALWQAERERGQSLAQRLDISNIERNWRILQSGIEDATKSFSALQACEMTIIRLCYAANIPNLESFLNGSMATKAPPNLDNEVIRAARQKFPDLSINIIKE